MKVFRLPQQLTNLETNSESDFCVGDQIDLESYDPTTCIGLIDSWIIINKLTYRFFFGSCWFPMLWIDHRSNKFWYCIFIYEV